MLAAYPADVDTVVFPNYESLPERDDVQDPFTEARPRRAPSPKLFRGYPLLHNMRSRATRGARAVRR